MNEEESENFNKAYNILWITEIIKNQKNKGVIKYEKN